VLLGSTGPGTGYHGRVTITGQRSSKGGRTRTRSHPGQVYRPALRLNSFRTYGVGNNDPFRPRPRPETKHPHWPCAQNARRVYLWLNLTTVARFFGSQHLGSHTPCRGCATQLAAWARHKRERLGRRGARPGGFGTLGNRPRLFLLAPRRSSLRHPAIMADVVTYRAEQVTQPALVPATKAPRRGSPPYKI